MPELSKKRSHGKIGEAAVSAKCWMHGLQAYNTGGLRANFAGSDILIESVNRRNKLWIQVKTGYTPTKGFVYLTQSSGVKDLTDEKFSSDFVVFVNIDPCVARHTHDGELDFNHLIYYIVPRDDANVMYRDTVNAEYRRPKRDGGQRSLNNMAVVVEPNRILKFRDAWHLIYEAANAVG